MGKRLQRYFSKDIPAALPLLAGKSASLVLRNGVSMFGTVLRKEGEKLLFEDKIPRLHYIDLDYIYEIVVDSEASH
jgi:hypothetical protein